MGSYLDFHEVMIPEPIETYLRCDADDNDDETARQKDTGSENLKIQSVLMAPLLLYRFIVVNSEHT